MKNIFKGVKKLLVIKLGALGDVVRTSYIINQIKIQNQSILIHWLTDSKSIDLLKFNTHIDSIFSLNNLSILSNEKYDLVLSLDDEVIASQIAVKIKPKKIIGSYYDDNLVKYTSELKEWFDMGIISILGKEKADILKKQNLKTHDEIFCDGLNLPKIRPSFFNDQIIEHKWFNKINKKNYLGINPFSYGKWKNKSLDINTLQKLVNLLNKNFPNFIIVLLGISSNSISIKGNFELWNTSSSVLEFAAAIKNLKILITCDSLALHLAVAQKIKTLAFFTSTSSAEINLFDNGIKIQAKEEFYCSYNSNDIYDSIDENIILNNLKKIISEDNN